ncbi:MAG TPA: hypothetical protein VLS27_17220 [Gammaproteobacteria bacterium]|nr:hypothetical protein [Gammaproteobacteria bacterium]
MPPSVPYSSESTRLAKVGIVPGSNPGAERWKAELPAFRQHWHPFMEGAARPGGGDPSAARHEALLAFARIVAGVGSD